MEQFIHLTKPKILSKKARPPLYIAIELSNKNVHVLSYGSYDGDTSKSNLIIKNT